MFDLLHFERNLTRNDDLISSKFKLNHFLSNAQVSELYKYV